MRDLDSSKRSTLIRRLIAAGAALGMFAIASPAFARTPASTQQTTAQPGTSAMGTSPGQGTTGATTGTTTGANNGAMAPGANQPGAMGTAAGTTGAGGIAGAQDNYGTTSNGGGRGFPWGILGLIGLVGLWPRRSAPTTITGNRTT